MLCSCLFFNLFSVSKSSDIPPLFKAHCITFLPEPSQKRKPRVFRTARKSRQRSLVPARLGSENGGHDSLCFATRRREMLLCAALRNRATNLSCFILTIRRSVYFA